MTSFGTTNVRKTFYSFHFFIEKNGVRRKEKEIAKLGFNHFNTVTKIVMIKGIYSKKAKILANTFLSQQNSKW